MDWFKKQSERRRHVRYKKHVLVEIKRRTYRVADSTAASVREGEEPAGELLPGKDISRSGLCFFSDRPLVVDDTMSLKIRISAPKERERRALAAVGVSEIPIHAEARVMWCRYNETEDCYEVGVNFVSIFEDDHKLLNRCLKAGG